METEMERNIPLIPTKKRLRFRDEDDQVLLREVLGLNPFATPALWVVIQEHVMLITGKSFSVKTLRDHLLLLIKLWLEKTKILKDKSGIEESFSEKDQLCFNIHELMAESAKKNIIPKRQRQQKDVGKINRDYWAKEFMTEKIAVSVKPAMENSVLENNEPCYLYDCDHDYSTEVVVGMTDNDLGEVLGKSAMENSVLENNEPSYLNDCDHDFSREVVLGATDKNVDVPVPVHLETPKTKQSSSKYNILARNKARTRRTGVQRQGLAYLEQHDKINNDLKKKDQELEEIKLHIEEEKLKLEKKRLEIEDRKVQLQEFEAKKNFQIQEERFKELTQIISNQEKLVNLLINKIN